jgi:hypothetical protein
MSILNEGVSREAAKIWPFEIKKAAFVGSLTEQNAFANFLVCLSTSLLI